MPDFWIQRANCSVEDYYDSEPASIIEALTTTDWSALVSERSELQNQGEICVYPGLGIVFENGEIIHLLEPLAQPYQGLFHYYTDRKFLGIFRWNDSYTSPFRNLTKDNLQKILTSWEPGQHDSIVKLLQANHKPNPS